MSHHDTAPPRCEYCGRPKGLRAWPSDDCIDPVQLWVCQTPTCWGPATARSKNVIQEVIQAGTGGIPWSELSPMLSCLPTGSENVQSEGDR